jgi:hypothetical protein
MSPFDQQVSDRVKLNLSLRGPIVDPYDGWGVLRLALEDLSESLRCTPTDRVPAWITGDIIGVAAAARQFAENDTLPNSDFLRLADAHYTLIKSRRGKPFDTYEQGYAVLAGETAGMLALAIASATADLRLALARVYATTRQMAEDFLLIPASHPERSETP